MQDYLCKATDDVLEQLRCIPMSAATVKYYKSCFKTISTYCEKQDILVFNEQVAMEFYRFQQNRLNNGEIRMVYCLTLRKAAFLLAEYFETGQVSWKRIDYSRKELCGIFESTMPGFENSMTGILADGSVCLIMQMARQYFKFIESKGIYDFKSITVNEIKDFVIFKAPSHEGSMVNLTWSLKKLFAYLNKEGLTAIEADRLLANPAPARKKVLPCFTSDEAESILAAVDITTALGKRDYAIIKLALGTGMRGIDIASLKLPDVNWAKNEISVIQSKTGRPLVLPLAPDVGNAVAEYILNARPKAESEYIFLRCRKPHDWLGNGPTGAIIIRRYQEKAGISHNAGDGKTFHAFRRTVGTELIKAGVPLSDTAQILGHKRLDSARQYISLDSAMMRFCCLDISGYATKKEGLR